MKNKILFLFLFCFGLQFSIAQKYAFKQHNVKNGLSSNAILDIKQTHDGYLWLATANGIVRFNGKDFEPYGEKEGLQSKIIFSLFEDSKKRLWIGSLDKGAYYIENGEIVSLEKLHAPDLYTVRHFLEDDDGYIYIICTNGVIKYKDGKSEVFPLKKDNGVSIKPRQAIFVDNSTMYLATVGTGIAVLNINNGDLSFIDSDSHDINNITYSIKKVDSSNNIWVGTYGEMIKMRSDSVIKKYKFNRNQYHQNRVTNIFVKDDNNLLLTFEGNGFAFFDTKTGQYEIINQSNGLPTNNCYTILKDNEENIWIGTDGFGLVRFRDKGFKLFDKTNGILSNVIYGMVATNGKNYISTDKGLVSFSGNKVLDTIYDKGPVYVLNSNIDKEVLFTNGSDIIILEEDGEKRYIDEEGFKMYVYKDEKATMVFDGHQLKVIEKDTVYTFKDKDELKPFISDLLPFADHHIFFTTGGLYQIQNGKINQIDLDKKVSVLSLSKIDETSFIVGSSKNIHFIKYQDSNYIKKTFPLERFGDLKGFRALEVIDNTLWLSGDELLKSIQLDKLINQDTVISKSYRIDRALFDAFGTNNLVTTYDKLLMGRTLESGLFVFNKNEYKRHEQPSKTRISHIDLFSEKLNDSLYRKNNNVILPYDKNYLTFHIEAISFTYPDNINYKFRLKGLRNNDEWSQPTKDNKVVYSYLPPGKYSFEFKADNGNNIWNETATTYNFEIKSPLWRNPWFWIVTIFVISGMVLFQMKRKSKLKEKQAQQFSQDLITAQEDERTRISKDLHDSVGQQLTLIKKKAQNLNQVELSKMSHDALEEVRSISRDLYPATLKQLGFTQSVEQLVNDLDEGVDMFFTVELDEIDSELDEEKSLNLYRFVQESLNNVIKHSNAKAVSVKISKNINQIEAIVSDNGKGFNSSVIKNSLGLKTMSERIKMLKGSLAIKSRINQGTTITAQIPI